MQEVYLWRVETARIVVYSGQFCCGVPLCTCVGSEVFVDVDFLFEIPQGVSKLKQIALASRIVMPFQSCSSSSNRIKITVCYSNVMSFSS